MFNNKDNIILLPNEEIHADIVGLPSHCPWDRRSHPKYTTMITNKLKEIRKTLDKALKSEDHEESISVTKKIIDDTQKELFDEIQNLKTL